MKPTTLALLTASALALTAACSKSKKPSTMVDPPTPTSTATAAPPRPSEPVAKTETLGVSDDLAARCALKFADPSTAPKFDFDEHDLGPSDRDLLNEIATCLTNGPLAGKQIHLVGRADPRGTTEYNMGLGARRAQAVRDYLRRLGVGDGQLAVNTRGSLDAEGKDESGWAVDRRVDLMIKN